MMTPKGAFARRRKYHYYFCTTKAHRTSEGCGAKDVPAEALETAVIKRLSEIASADGVRERISDEAIRQVEADAVRIDSEKATAQHRLSEVSNQIGKLTARLRSPGFAALESVELDLQQLESEQTQLREQIATLDAEGGPLNEVITAAKAFLSNWSGVNAAILEEATAEELRNVLPHFVEVMEIRASDDGKRGEYTSASCRGRTPPKARKCRKQRVRC